MSLCVVFGVGCCLLQTFSSKMFSMIIKKLAVFLQVRKRAKGHPTPPTFAMQCRHQFYFFKVLCMGKFATQFATL